MPCSSAPARADLLIARSQLQGVANSLVETQTAARRETTGVDLRRGPIAPSAARDRMRGSLPLQVAGLAPGLSTTTRAACEDGRRRRASGARRRPPCGDSGQERRGDHRAQRVGLDVASSSGFADDAERAADRIGDCPALDQRGQWDCSADRDEGTLLWWRSTPDNASRPPRALCAPPCGLLGASGPRRYLIALQNNAEMRDQGMVLSFAVAEAADGRIRVVRTGRTTEAESAALG